MRQRARKSFFRLRIFFCVLLPTSGRKPRSTFRRYESIHTKGRRTKFTHQRPENGVLTGYDSFDLIAGRGGGSGRRKKVSVVSWLDTKSRTKSLVGAAKKAYVYVYKFYTTNLTEHVPTVSQCDIYLIAQLQESHACESGVYNIIMCGD